MKLFDKSLYPRLLLLIIPGYFIYLNLTYKDSFYLFLGILSLIVSILVIFPSLLNKQLRIQTQIHKKHLDKDNISLSNEKSSVKQRGKIKSFLQYRIHSILFWVLLIFFTAITIILLPSVSAPNIFVEYLVSYRKLIYTYPIIVGLLITTIIIDSLLSVYRKKIQIEHKKSYLLKNVLINLIITIESFVYSLFIVFVLLIIEMNVVAIQINFYPKSVGLIWGKQAILTNLNSRSQPPLIVGVDKSINTTIYNQVINNQPGSDYYKKSLIKIIPSILVIPIHVPNESLIMLSNSLLITSINKDDLQAISPKLSQLLVVKYFNSRFVKNPPEITILGRQDYLKFREDQFNEQIAKLDTAITETQQYLNTIYGNIANAKQKISNNQSGYDSTIAQRDSAYSYCINAGYFFYGYFYHTFSQSYCGNQLAQWNVVASGFLKNISDWQSTLQYNQGLINQYVEVLNTLKNYKTIIESQKESTPQELGVFEPDNHIKIALDDVSSKAVVDFVETMIHEYLHYTSYVSKDSTLPQFFEEGLTEYYARQAVKQEIGVDTNIGYPLIVKIISQMITKLDKNELESIYFAKDNKRLVALLDSTFGKDFYKDTEYYFLSLSFVSDQNALKIANNIMFKIGGKELKINDLYNSGLQNN